METEIDFKPQATAETTAEAKPKRRRKNAPDGAPKARKRNAKLSPTNYPTFYPPDKDKRVRFWDGLNLRWLGEDYLNYCFNGGAFDRTALPTAEAIIKASSGDYFCSLDSDRVFRKRHQHPQYRNLVELGRLVPTGAV